MLTSILDAKITKKFVRLGSRSTDERIGEYSLRNLERAFADVSMNRQLGREFACKKKIEEQMVRVMEDIQIPEPSEDQIKEYLQANWEQHLLMMYEPPFWITEYASRLWEPEPDAGGEWKTQGKKGKGKEESQLMARTYYGLWKRGLDIAFIQPPQPRFITAEPPKKRGKKKKQGGGEEAQLGTMIPPTLGEQEAYHQRMFEFFSDLGFGDSVPPVPTGNRPFVQLENLPAVWAMSFEERQRLAEHWEEEMRRLAYDDHLGEYQTLREQYEEACEKYEAVADEVRIWTIFKCYAADTPDRGSVVC